MDPLKNILGQRLKINSKYKKGDYIQVTDKDDKDYGKTGRIIRVDDHDFFHVNINGKLRYITDAEIKKRARKV